MEREYNTNNAIVSGLVLSDAVFSHKSYGEIFYSFALGIERKSGYMDEIQIILSERLILDLAFSIRDNVKILGQVRTYNEIENEHNRLHIVIFAREFDLLPDEGEPEYENKITLEGFLCKAPQLRTSPLGREICDLMLAVNRMYNKSDYVPCIAWGRNARYASSLDVGKKINLLGRIQSREYRKKTEDGDSISKTAYEVSILKIEEEEEFSD